MVADGSKPRTVLANPEPRQRRSTRVSMPVLERGNGGPALSAVGRHRGDPRLWVVLLPGGRVRSTRASRRSQLTYLRMLSLGGRLERECGRAGAAIALVRYRVRGWNEPQQDAVIDGRWAIRSLRGRAPGVPVALVGHSMGGRAALRLAGEPGVTAVCALAPWIEPGEPVEQLAGRTAVIAHGDRDRKTDPAASRRFGARAGATWLGVPGAGHAMVRLHPRWAAVVRGFVDDALAVAGEPGERR